MIICKLRRPFLIPLQFVPYDDPFIWYAIVTWDGYTTPSDFSSDFDFTTPALNITDVEISTVYVDNISYESKTSIANTAAQEGSFYFDITNQIIYVHLFHEKRFPSSIFNSLKVIGYCSERVIYDDNKIEFLPLLTSALSINQTADRLVYGKMGLINNNATFSNKTADFDEYIDSPVPGSDVNFLYLSQDDYDIGLRTGTPIYTGYAAQDDYTSNGEYVLSVQDKRAQLTADIPNTRFNSTDFPNIDDNVDGLIIPEGYGDIKGMPAFCTNGTVLYGDIEFKYATDGTSITTVYVKIDDEWITVTTSTTTPLSGEFALSPVDAKEPKSKTYSASATIGDIHSYITAYLGTTAADTQPAFGTISYSSGTQKVIDYIYRVSGGDIRIYMTDSTYITVISGSTTTLSALSPAIDKIEISLYIGSIRQCKVDARLRDIDSPGDIMVDMIERTFGDLFSAEKYNTTDWTAEAAYLADIYLYMGEQKSFFEYIEEIQNASDYGFRFDIDQNGKYTIKVDDLYRSTVAHYDYIDIISDTLKITRNFEEYATSVRVGYSYDQESGRGSAVVSDSLEQQVFNEYRVKKERRFKSNLTNSTDAQNKADRIALDYSKARNKVSFSIESIVYRQIYDIITVDTSKYIDGVKVREYMGTRKLKISGIRLNFGIERTELTGYDITDIT